MAVLAFVGRRKRTTAHRCVWGSPWCWQNCGYCLRSFCMIGKGEGASDGGLGWVLFCFFDGISRLFWGGKVLVDGIFLRRGPRWGLGREYWEVDGVGLRWDVCWIGYCATLVGSESLEALLDLKLRNERHSSYIWGSGKAGGSKLSSLGWMVGCWTWDVVVTKPHGIRDNV